MSIDDDFRVEVIGHATLRVQCAGKTLLTDPWLVDPIGSSNGFHYPPLVHDAQALAAQTDAIYISHIHPDHFNPPTLKLFSPETPVYIGAYRRKEFRDAIRRLGFRVIEVPFQQSVSVEGTAIEINIIEHDYAETAAYDSSIVVGTPDFTLFENNDCFLRAERYAWIRDHFDIDYAFLGYSPASFFPICFEMEPQEKARLLAQAAERRYHDFVQAAEILTPRLAIPFASGARFLHTAALWKNVSFNSAPEAARRVRARGLRAEVMGPGDRIAADGRIRRVSEVLEMQDEIAAISDYARRVQGWVEGLQPLDPPEQAGLVERFRDHILSLWRAHKPRLPGVQRYVIAYVLRGTQERRFYFDFSKPDDQIFQWGEAPRYDMRYTYTSSGLQRTLDGELDWDELHFTDSVSVHQISYAREFYMMLRSEFLDLDRSLPHGPS